MAEDKTKIELSDPEVELFLLFRKYQDTFKLLVDNGVFDARKSIVTISINDQQIITNIDVNTNKYRRNLTDGPINP